MKLKKYKQYNKILNAFSYPSRILKFKKTKWFVLKSLINKKLSSLKTDYKIKKRNPLGYVDSKKEINKLSPIENKTFKFYNKFKIFVPKGRFLSISKFAKSKALLKTQLKDILHLKNFIKLKFKKDRDIFIKNIYSHSFDIHGVFSYFYFLKSYKELKDSIKKSSINLNDVAISNLKDLKCGDIIQLSSQNPINLNKNIGSLVFGYKLPSHIEVDIYTQTVVLIKSQAESSYEDYNLLSLEYINADKV